MGTLCNSAKRQSMEQKMNGKLKKAGILALMGALVLAAVGGIASAMWMHRQLKGCETLLDKAVGIISAKEDGSAKKKRKKEQGI